MQGLISGRAYSDSDTLSLHNQAEVRSCFKSTLPMKYKLTLFKYEVDSDMIPLLVFLELLHVSPWIHYLYYCIKMHLLLIIHVYSCNKILRLRKTAAWYVSIALCFAWLGNVRLARHSTLGAAEEVGERPPSNMNIEHDEHLMARSHTHWRPGTATHQGSHLSFCRCQ